MIVTGWFNVEFVAFLTTSCLDRGQLSVLTAAHHDLIQHAEDFGFENRHEIFRVDKLGVQFSRTPKL